MNAGQAAKLVMGFIGADENSITRVRQILRLACNHAWGKGKWWGMTADFHCQVFLENAAGGKPYILSPTGYDTLLAINSGGKPRLLRDSYFMFHQNGPGDIKGHDYCQWNTDVYDVGNVPTLRDINNYGACGVMVGIRSLGVCGEDEFVTIQGKTEDGNHALSYEYAEKNKCNCIQATSEDGEAPAVRSIHGLRIKVTNKFEFIDNVKLTSIEAITKTITRCPIEVIVIDKNGAGYIESRMNPWDTESAYRKFYVPTSCRGTVHGLFKIAEQPEIVDDSQPIIISSHEALLALCKGMDLKYYKEQAGVGDKYLIDGIIALNDQVMEKKSPVETPIQVVGLYAGEDIPGIMKH